MKAVVITGERKVELVDQPKPTPGPNEVLIKVHTCMLCTVEQRIFTRVMSNPLPYNGGHEFSGVIEAVGSCVNPGDYPVGARCAASYTIPCGACPACRRGNDSMCLHKMRNRHVQGKNGLAEYTVVGAGGVYVYPDTVPFERIMFAEPLACVVSAHDKFPVQLGDQVGIQGAGIMGMMHGLLAKMRGAYVTIIEPNAERRKKALGLGFCDAAVDPTGVDPADLARKASGQAGFDVIINTTAIPGTVALSLPMCAQGGTFLMYGKVFPDPNVSININIVQDQSLKIAGTMGGDIRSFDRARKLFVQERICPEKIGFIAGVYPKEQAQKAYETAIVPYTFRVGISF